MSSKNAGMSDFVRDAVKEKAARELQALHERGTGFGAMERARDALYTVRNELVQLNGGANAVSVDSVVLAKVRKLRKLVDDAHVLASEVCDGLGLDAQKVADEAARNAILDALKAAGIDPDSLKPAASPGNAATAPADEAPASQN